MRNTPNRRARRGFTLIELLVVVSIIALLIAILLPSLQGARDQAKGTVCLANCRRLGTAMALYLSANREMLPPFRLKNHPLAPNPVEYVNAHGRAKPRWHWFIANELGPVIDPKPFTPPFGDNDVGARGESGLAMTNDYFMCPSLTGEYANDIRNGAYGYNYQYLGNSRTDTNPAEFDYFAVNADRLPAAAQTVLFADSRGADRTHGKHSYTLDPPRLAVERNATHFGPGAGDVSAGLDATQFAYSPVEMRHRERGNVVYLDGHAEAQRLTELGYQLDAKGYAVPIDPRQAVDHIATNKLWTGSGRDEFVHPTHP